MIGPQDAAAQRGPTLQRFLDEAGQQVVPRVRDMFLLAAAVQHERHSRNVSDTDRLTRSTLLWVLTSDPDVGPVLAGYGLDRAELGQVLSVASAPTISTPTPVLLHDDLATALRRFLLERPAADRRRPLVPADLAILILSAGRGSSSGLLPSRLRQLGLDVDGALRALERLLPVGGMTSPNAPKALALSESMRSVGRELEQSGSGRGITACAIGRLIATRHGEYGSNALGRVEFSDAAAAKRRSWKQWRDLVARQFDHDAVSRSGHEVLDGRLFLVGLALLDPQLNSALSGQGAWAPLLLEIDDAVAADGSPLRSVLQSVQFDYGYHSDRVSGEDQLGIQGEVNALCEVILDARVRPPLAIGLFGEWGSGKSFFMERLRRRISERSQSAPAAGNVVQIRFNAWHYADTSLWASLAIEIFERLVDPEPVDDDGRERWLLDRGDVSRTERDNLLTNLETYQDARAVLEIERTQLTTKREAVKRGRKKAADRRRAEVDSMRITDVAGEVAKDPRVRDAVGEVGETLGVKPAAEELIALGAELRTASGYLPAVWRLVRGKAWAMACAAAVVVLLLLTAALMLRGGSAWIGSLATAVGSVGTVLLGAVRFLRPAARKVNAALDAVESAITTTSEVEAELRTRRSQEEKQLDLTLTDIDREIAEATQTIAGLDEQIAVAEATAQSLTVGRKLYEFLADRATGYQRHQGIVGTLHRDFRFLDSQLRAHRAGAGPATPLPEIDRVVLYIDDLDRCPPPKVLEVLEAVHLLLALELFVVVVGVDPRWLQRSLRHQYRDLVGGGDPASDAYLRVMPVEYLEKIFQIPLTLPAMEPQGYAQLIASLAPDTVPSAAPGAAREDQAYPRMPAERIDLASATGTERVPTRAPFDVQPGSAASGDIGQPVDLLPGEVAFAQGLGAMVGSPRAAKRLMNTYRLIRATQNVGSRSRFLGGDGRPGEYQAVLTLLAVAAGYPTSAYRLLVALEQDAGRLGITRWATFVHELRPGDGDRPAGRIAAADASRGDALGEPTAWTALYEGLSRSLDGTTLEGIEPYQRWGRIAARFSFTL